MTFGRSPIVEGGFVSRRKAAGRFWHSGSVPGVGWSPHTRPERKGVRSPTLTEEVLPGTHDLLLPQVSPAPTLN